MSWNPFGRKDDLELRRLRQELSLQREQISGLHDTLSQLVSKSEYSSPNFMYAQLAPGTSQDIEDRVRDIRAEIGHDCIDELIKVRRFSEAFLLRYIESGREEGGQRLQNLKLAIQSEQNHSPFQNLLFEAYQREFRDQNRNLVQSFQERFLEAEILVMHLSCRPRAYLASQSAATFVDQSARIRNIIVIGHDAGKNGAYHFEPGTGVLIVPASDSYEGLSEKSAAAYAFLAFSGVECSVLKVDDDIRCLQSDYLLEKILPLAKARDYLGKVWHAKYGFSRTWHLGKCTDQRLNTKPYGLLANASYAEGPAYFLSARAIQVLGKSAIYLENHFETERSYEDIAVGKILNNYGINPTNVDLIKEGVLGSTDAWMMERAGLGSL